MKSEKIDSIIDFYAKERFRNGENNLGESISKRIVVEDIDSLGLTDVLVKKFPAEDIDINWIAFKGIIPQVVFSIVLFSLLLIGIYFLKKGYQDQQILLENKNILISNITHELKTPVTTIGLALEAIQDFNVKEDKEKTNAYIRTSRRELNRLSESIDQVLQLGKMDENQILYKFEKRPLKEVFEELISSFKLRLEKSNSKLEIKMPDQSIELEIDEYHFKNMLFNLLDNGLKYGKENGLIQLELSETEKEVLIKIEDDGEGIESKYHDKIFERFFRVPTGNRHNVKGYGLGLTYVKEIVEAHNGTIQVQSKKGKGASFILKIPKSNA